MTPAGFPGERGLILSRQSSPAPDPKPRKDHPDEEVLAASVSDRLRPRRLWRLSDRHRFRARWRLRERDLPAQGLNLCPPGCVPVRARGVESTSALKIRKDKPR